MIFHHVWNNESQKKVSLNVTYGWVGTMSGPLPILQAHARHKGQRYHTFYDFISFGIIETFDFGCSTGNIIFIFHETY